MQLLTISTSYLQTSRTLTLTVLQRRSYRQRQV
jgi:hypothetical protein